MAELWREAANRLKRRVREIPVLLLRRSRKQKRAVLVCVDSLLCILAVLVAFSLRVGALSFPIEPPLIFSAVCVPLFIGVFFASNVYSAIVRFIGARSIFQLARAIFVYAIPLIILFMVVTVRGVPRTIAILQPVLFLGLAATARIVARSIFMDVSVAEGGPAGRERVLVYGAGRFGKQLATALRHDPRFVLAGFVDDDLLLDRQQLDGTPIIHSSKLGKAIGHKIDLVLLALPRASRKRRQEIIAELRQFHVHVKTLPDFQQLVTDHVSISDLREVQIEDLLGRGTVTPNQLLLGRTVVSKTVLVTGAGGSIGSELCRQIVAIGPKRLVLFDVSEFSLYQIERELSEWCQKNDRGDIEIVAMLGSVIDKDRLASVFQTWRPDTVFHAAAYKHVPLVEKNPIEAIRNNVLGTLEVVTAADLAGATNFIQISTDKAVRPTNIMGATKRAAEQVVQAFAAASGKTRYSIVRFGNVLGSSGSVVPLFRQQIKAGGPITLTHNEITRYFMTIPEAAQLVLQAAGLAHGGEVFVLDMGEPVKIASLARAMVQLSGLTVRSTENPEGDIEIIEVGLRPGEKLYEELLIGNSPLPTRHKQIWMAREEFKPLAELRIALARLAATLNPDEAIGILRGLVPEFYHLRDNELDAHGAFGGVRQEPHDAPGVAGALSSQVDGAVPAVRLS